MSEPVHPLQNWQRLVHGPLAHWAQVQPNAVAIDDGTQRISFAQLHAAMQAGADQLNASAAPSTRLLDAAQPPIALITDFLATNASGRCAALGDAAWPAAQRAVAQGWIDALAAKTAAGAQPERANSFSFNSNRHPQTLRQSPHAAHF